MKHKHKIDRPHALRAIKLLYARANGNQSAVARALGVHSAHISDALRTGNISPKLAAALVDRGAIEPIPRRICRAWRTRDPGRLDRIDDLIGDLGLNNVQQLIDALIDGDVLILPRGYIDGDYRSRPRPRARVIMSETDWRKLQETEFVATVIADVS